MGLILWLYHRFAVYVSLCFLGELVEIFQDLRSLNCIQTMHIRLQDMYKASELCYLNSYHKNKGYYHQQKNRFHVLLRKRTNH